MMQIDKYTKSLVIGDRVTLAFFSLSGCDYRSTAGIVIKIALSGKVSIADIRDKSIIYSFTKDGVSLPRRSRCRLVNKSDATQTS